jgi:hypothetical protein
MIEILESVAGGDYAYAKGEIVHNCPPERASDLIRAGYARQIDGSPAYQRIKATDKKAEQRLKR